MTTFCLPREQEREIYLKEIERLNKINDQLLEACEVIKGWIGNPDDGVDPIRWDFSFEPPWYKKLSVAIAAAKEKER